MKEKIFKKTTSLLSILSIVCMLTVMLIPNFVKSAQIVVSSTSNTNHGIGKAEVWTAKINGYSNLYCVRGGAMLETGMQLEDDGVSLYTTTGEIVKNSSAIQWLLDNIYLTEETNAETQKAMKENLKRIVKKYSTYTDSEGNSLLNKKLNGNGIDDNWINSAVEDVVNDKETLYAIQQFAIWKNVKNRQSYCDDAMRNSDGSYNVIPNAKARRANYTGVYIALTELAAEAQKNGYKSPNSTNRGFDIKIEKQANFQSTVSNDKKTILAGPYKLKNNHPYLTKSFSATINSDKADKVETVNAKGESISVTDTQGEFYVKVTYNKGIAKGTEYKININVNLSGYRTFATLLDTKYPNHQPLVTIRKEKYKTNTETDITLKEELQGDYNLELEKVDSTDINKKIEGVTFKVKEGSGDAKSYGPTGSNGKVTVFTGKKISRRRN